MITLTERCEKLFNSKEWCDADANGLRGLEDHIPLLEAFAREIRNEAFEETMHHDVRLARKALLDMDKST